MFNLYVTVNTPIVWSTGGTGNEMIQLQKVKTETKLPPENEGTELPKGYVKAENTVILFVCPFALYRGILLKTNVLIKFFITSFLRSSLRLYLTLRRLMSYIYGAPILDVSRSHNDAAKSVGLLWTSDQLVAETST